MQATPKSVFDFILDFFLLDQMFTKLTLNFLKVYKY